MFLDNTTLSDFRLCPRKGQYRHLHHLVPVEAKELAAQFGIAIHLGLEQIFIGAGLQEAIRMFEDYFVPLGIEDNKRNVANGRKMLGEYVEIYGEDPGKWHFKVARNESLFKAIISRNVVVSRGKTTTNLNETYYGIIDKIIQYTRGPREGELWALDHKTSSSSSSFVERPNHQFTSYIWLLRENGFPVKGLIVDLLGVYVENTKIEKQARYTRRETTRSDFEIEEWKRVTLETVDRIERYKEEWNWFPQEDNACSSYGGCVYKDLCLARDEKTLRLLMETMYTQKPWGEMVLEGRRH